MTSTSLDSRKLGNLLLTELEICSARIPEAFNNFKMLQLSDLHLGSLTSEKKIDHVFKTANALKPDLLLLTGDYIQQDGIGIYYKVAERNAKLWRKYRLGTRKLATTLIKIIEERIECKNIIGIFGNHDHHDGLGTVRRVLSKRVTFLKNQSYCFEKDGAQIAFYGIDDFKFGKPDLKKTFDLQNTVSKAAILAPCFNILLSHNPDTILLKDNELLNNVDLMLSGHTHGGQICLPKFGPIRTSTRQKEHIKGLSQFKNMRVYVNNGIGHCLLPMRFLSPPEITVIRLRKVD